MSGMAQRQGLLGLPLKPAQIGRVFPLMPAAQIQENRPRSTPQHQGCTGRETADLVQGNDRQIPDLFTSLPSLRGPGPGSVSELTVPD